MKIFYFLKSIFFSSLNWQVFYPEGHKTLCLGLVCWKTKPEQNFQFLTTNHGLTPLEKCKIFDFSKSMFCSLKWLDFYLRGHKTLCFGLFCWKTNGTKCPISHQKSWTNPFGKMPIFYFLESTFFSFKMDSFPCRMSQNTLFRTILLKKKQKPFLFLTKNQGKLGKNFLIFDQKSWTNPLKKI